MNENGGSVESRVYEIVRMNLAEFLGSKTNKDPQNFPYDIQKIVEVM